MSGTEINGRAITRRGFIKGLFGLGVLSILPLPALGSLIHRSMPDKIRVVGIGSAGCNVIRAMIRAGMEEGVEFIAAGTNSENLGICPAPVKILLGPTLTKGLGAGADPSTGWDAAMESRDSILEVVANSSLLVIAAGMGGGTGTGGAPVVALVARDLGIKTVAVVVTPFTFEGRKRRDQAHDGVEALAMAANELITVDNQTLCMNKKNRSFIEMLTRCDDALVHEVRSAIERHALAKRCGSSRSQAAT